MTGPAIALVAGFIRDVRGAGPWGSSNLPGQDVAVAAALLSALARLDVPRLHAHDYVAHRDCREGNLGGFKLCNCGAWEGLSIETASR